VRLARAHSPVRAVGQEAGRQAGAPVLSEVGQFRAGDPAASRPGDRKIKQQAQEKIRVLIPE